VFVQGCFWHGHACRRAKIPETNGNYWRAKIERNMERDERTRAVLENAGWRVFTLWTCRLPSDLDELLNFLTQSRHAAANDTLE
jgi:DNA mismatch endonuclease (patch repair protein)